MKENLKMWFIFTMTVEEGRGGEVNYYSAKERFSNFKILFSKERFSTMGSLLESLEQPCVSQAETALWVAVREAFLLPPRVPVSGRWAWGGMLELGPRHFAVGWACPERHLSHCALLKNDLYLKGREMKERWRLKSTNLIAFHERSGKDQEKNKRVLKYHLKIWTF